MVQSWEKISGICSAWQKNYCRFLRQIQQYSNRFHCPFSKAKGPGLETWKVSIPTEQSRHFWVIAMCWVCIKHNSCSSVISWKLFLRKDQENRQNQGPCKVRCTVPVIHLLGGKGGWTPALHHRKTRVALFQMRDTKITKIPPRVLPVLIVPEQTGEHSKFPHFSMYFYVFHEKKQQIFQYYQGKNYYALVLKIQFGFLIHFLLIWKNFSEFKDSVVDSGKHKIWCSKQKSWGFQCLGTVTRLWPCCLVSAKVGKGAEPSSPSWDTRINVCWHKISFVSVPIHKQGISVIAQFQGCGGVQFLDPSISHRDMQVSQTGSTSQ